MAQPTNVFEQLLNNDFKGRSKETGNVINGSQMLQALNALQQSLPSATMVPNNAMPMGEDAAMGILDAADAEDMADRARSRNRVLPYRGY